MLFDREPNCTGCGARDEGYGDGLVHRSGCPHKVKVAIDTPFDWPLLHKVGVEGGLLEISEARDGSILMRTKIVGVDVVNMILTPDQRYELTRALAKGIRR